LAARRCVGAQGGSVAVCGRHEAKVVACGEVMVPWWCMTARLDLGLCGPQHRGMVAARWAPAQHGGPPPPSQWRSLRWTATWQQRHRGVVAGQSSKDGVLLQGWVGWVEVHETLDENLLGLRS
jgi:hypothetical protein